MLKIDTETAISALWTDMTRLRSNTSSFAEVEVAHAAEAICHQQPAPSYEHVEKVEGCKSDNAARVQAQEEVDMLGKVIADAWKQGKCLTGASNCEECLGKVERNLAEVRHQSEHVARALPSSMQCMEIMETEIEKVAKDVEMSRSQLQVGVASEWEAIMGRTRETSKWAGLLKATAQHAEDRFVELNGERRKLNQRLVQSKKCLDNFVNHAHLVRRNPAAA